MYSFAQRKDTCVVDEPLYAHYLTQRPNKQAQHPVAQQVLATQQHDGNEVIADLLLPHAKPVLFAKQMAHHLVNLDLSFLPLVDHIILIRDPREVLLSYSKVVAQPQAEDVGYAVQVELIHQLDALGVATHVIDARRVLENPKDQLQQLCTSLGLAFDSAMLSWPKGARAEDGIWAKYWYKNVHSSTGFAPYRPKYDQLPSHLRGVYDECLPAYQVLLERAI